MKQVWTSDSGEAETANLTDNSEHAGGLGGLSVTFVFSLIVKYRLVDDEDVLATLSDDFVFLPLSDFTSILKPADLQESRDEEISASVKLYWWFFWTDRQSGRPHFDVLSGDFTFKPGRFLLSDLHITERLGELDLWSWRRTE